MTKRALIVISILILLPIIATAVIYSKFEDSNPVVAEYGGDVRIIIYEDKTLHAVEGDENYYFRFGEYLGRVSDRVRGTSLYKVADDATGEYFAIANGDRMILYTESGKLIDGVKNENSIVTRVVFGDYIIVEENEENIAVLNNMMETESKKFLLDISEYIEDGEKKFEFRDIYAAYDGSAIVTEHIGRIYRLIEKNKWIYVSPEALAIADEKYGIDSTRAEFNGVSIESIANIRLLMSYAGMQTEENRPVDTTDETSEGSTEE